MCSSRALLTTALGLLAATGPAAQDASAAAENVPADGRVRDAPAPSAIRSSADRADAARFPAAAASRATASAAANTSRSEAARAHAGPSTWAFRRPARVEPPALDALPPALGARVRTPVDRFVFAAMQEAGVEPAPDAAPHVLLRRLHLDLTGLLPEPDDLLGVAAAARRGFDADAAFDDALERLLVSPRHAEHQTRTWLDLARYGDTHGLHLDNERSMWPYRDWVLGAYRDNLAFDEFTRAQIAGDLLPRADRDSRVATGFLRANVTTGEGGLIAEEYLAKYAFDRVDTVSTVWLGLTVGCAQCHDHKYDPISQREYYGLFAFFHSIAEEGSDRNAMAPPPNLRLPSEEQEWQLAALDAQIRALEAVRDGPMPEIDRRQEAWQARLLQEAMPWDVLHQTSWSFSDGSRGVSLDDGSLRVEGEHPEFEDYVVTLEPPTARGGAPVDALRLELLQDPEGGVPGVGRAGHRNFVISDLVVEQARVDAEPRRDGDAADPAGGSVTAWRRIPVADVVADDEQRGYEARQMVDDDPVSGWANDGRPADLQAVLRLAEPLTAAAPLRITLRHRSQHPRHGVRRVRFAAHRASPTGDAALRPTRWGAWETATAVFGGAEAAADAAPPAESAWEPAPETWNDPRSAHVFPETTAHGVRFLRRWFEAPSDRSLRLTFGRDDGLVVFVDGEEVLRRTDGSAVRPDAEEVEVDVPAGRHELRLHVINGAGATGFAFRLRGERTDPVPTTVRIALEHSDEPARATFLRRHYRTTASPGYAGLTARIDALRSERGAVERAVPRALVAAELDTPRPTHVLERGDYRRRGAPVVPHVPAALHPMRVEDGRRPSRLDLADWLVDPANPLTARVEVDRIWRMLFGRGLVDTPEDWGTRSTRPPLQGLLDWLANELVDSGWDRRHVIRTIVRSTTWRQAGRDAAAVAAAASGLPGPVVPGAPRFRLDAEVLRDTALQAAGLLVHRFGGPSVRPYQPDGLWRAVAYPTSNTARFRRDDGPALWRRSVYTFWKRTSPPPVMTAFDAPSRESCTSSRARTNTPVQALALWNDVQFVEAARGFAARILRETGPSASDRDRLDHAARIALSRTPDEDEARTLAALLDDLRARFGAAPADASALLEVGESPPPAAGSDPAELASWTMVCSALLNLDETLTRN